MHLRDSLTEQGLRDQLIRGNLSLQARGVPPSLLTFLAHARVDLRTAYFLDYLAEQGEDIYTILDGDRRVITVELLRHSQEPPLAVETCSFEEYRRLNARKSRHQRLLFAVAIDLVRRSG